jgi:hypothetical protein
MTKYNNFVAAIEGAAQDVVGPAPGKKIKHWVSSETTALLNKRNQAKRHHKEDRKQLSQELLKSYENDRNKFLTEKLNRLTEAAKANKLRTTWEVVNEISGKTKSKNKHKMKKADGNIVSSPKELLNEWQNYFKTLLNNEVVTEEVEDLPIDPAIKDLPIETFHT